MKILFVCHRLPFPPKRGGKIRPFHIIRHLAESGHCVTVCSLARSEEERLEGVGLQEYCDKMIISTIGKTAAVAHMIGRLPTPVPSSMGYFYSRSLQHRIRWELKNTEYDLIFVHCSSAAQYVRSVTGIPSILDFGDMDSQKWLDYAISRRFPLSIGYWLEGTKLRREEERLAGEFDLCTCTTRAELETLNGFGAALRTDWFPNGVDADFFAPSAAPYEADQICFIGRMDYYPNQQAMHFFCNSVLPLIQARRPSTKLTIIGAEPPAEIRKLEKKHGVTVTGTVADVRSQVRRSALSVAPLAIARGTQNKILESMAMGVPVVCSEKAARGVDAVPTDHLVTAETASDYVKAVITILDNENERRRLAIAARNRILTHHSWVASMTRLDSIVSSLNAGNIERNADE